MNFKANHRKTLTTEKEVLVSSANPHDGSSDHSNIAFAVKGALVPELVRSEEAVMAFSGYNVQPLNIKTEETGKYEVKLITEGKIREQLELAINNSQKRRPK